MPRSSPRTASLRARHPGAVGPRTPPPTRPGSPFRLTAFVVLAAQHATADAADLRDFCARTLPPYMVPQDIRLRDSLPTTSNGKVDRAALAEGARTDLAEADGAQTDRRLLRSRTPHRPRPGPPRRPGTGPRPSPRARVRHRPLPLPRRRRRRRRRRRPCSAAAGTDRPVGVGESLEQNRRARSEGRPAPPRPVGRLRTGTGGRTA
ncbi:AMP-binding enzyme [Streptomyces inhibens]|uniref:AMP-binding enzyme n=1 Tax=Streptomyces inhibens TaxID=2293571 RepID=UPI00402AFDE5